MPLTEEELLIQKMDVIDQMPDEELATPEGIDKLLGWLYTMYHLPGATEQEQKEWLYHMRGLYSLKSRLLSSS